MYHIKLEKEEYKEQNSEAVFQEKVELKHHPKKDRKKCRQECKQCLPCKPR